MPSRCREGPHNAPDSGGGKLEDPNGFKRFMEEAIATLRQRGVFKEDFVLGDIILSGHSGGYFVMSAIVDRGGLTPHIKEVWLFDALYAQGDKFPAWSQRPDGRLLNIYTDDGGAEGAHGRNDGHFERTRNKHSGCHGHSGDNFRTARTNSFSSTRAWVTTTCWRNARPWRIPEDEFLESRNKD
ncbi:MAG: hypothetical protein U1F83_10140 [Verrucomicrobiota bacterium]